MAYIPLIYTVSSSQTVLIQQYKLIHVNCLLPKTYSSLLSSFLPLDGSPCGPPSICPISSLSELFHPAPVSSVLATQAFMGGLQSPGSLSIISVSEHFLVLIQCIKKIIFVKEDSPACIGVLTQLMDDAGNSNAYWSFSFECTVPTIVLPH